MAHRGGHLEDEAPIRENSLHAFRQAVALGFNYLETDVHASRDGKLIAFHDSVLDRVTDMRGVVADLPFKHVRRARIGGMDQIPTVDELLEEFPNQRFNIDIKAAGAVEPLAETIKRHRAHDRVCVASFSERRLRAFRRLVGASVASSQSTLAVAWSLMVPKLPQVMNFSGQAFQIPVCHQVMRTSIRVLTKRLMAVAHQRDMRVQVWTVNEVDEMRRLIEVGVGGIITDRIEVLKSVTQDFGIW